MNVLLIIIIIVAAIVAQWYFKALAQPDWNKPAGLWNPLGHIISWAAILVGLVSFFVLAC